MNKLMIKVGLALAVLQSFPLDAQDGESGAAKGAAGTSSTELWGGLYAGMKPGYAQRVIEATPGVKRAKYGSTHDGYVLMDVNVDSTFKLAGKSSKIALAFKDDGLIQVQFSVLNDRESGECIVGGARNYNFFNEAPSSKYRLASGTPKVDDELANRLALQSRAAAFQPFNGSDPVDDVKAVYTNGGDLLIQTTLLTSGHKYSSSPYAKMTDCSRYGFLDARLQITYMSKHDASAITEEKEQERNEAAAEAAEDL